MLDLYNILSLNNNRLGCKRKHWTGYLCYRLGRTLLTDAKPSLTTLGDTRSTFQQELATELGWNSDGKGGGDSR